MLGINRKLDMEYLSGNILALTVSAQTEILVLRVINRDLGYTYCQRRTRRRMTAYRFQSLQIINQTGRVIIR